MFVYTKRMKQFIFFKNLNHVDSFSRMQKKQKIRNIRTAAFQSLGKRKRLSVSISTNTNKHTFVRYALSLIVQTCVIDI